MKIATRIFAVCLIALAVLVAIIPPEPEMISPALAWMIWLRWPAVVLWLWQGISLLRSGDFFSYARRAMQRAAERRERNAHAHEEVNP